ncbi:MAG: flavodoxin family protein [Oscillospiraceae bacterium]|nr:flavodoxin family protein [Oscillospiraceae bacterium]
MNVCILMASPRLNGNTAEILKPFVKTLTNAGAAVNYITLSDKDIKPCKGCYACQHIADEYGCVIKDDVQDIVNAIIMCDTIVFATPIYTWYCTAPMKALLDRHYGLNKFYGKAARGSLWAGKKVAIVATHGYDEKYACEPFETGIIRLCEHSDLKYLGMYSARHLKDKTSFQTPEAVSGAEEFARHILSNAN